MKYKPRPLIVAELCWVSSSTRAAIGRWYERVIGELSEKKLAKYAILQGNFDFMLTLERASEQMFDMKFERLPFIRHRKSK